MVKMTIWRICSQLQQNRWVGRCDPSIDQQDHRIWRIWMSFFREYVKNCVQHTTSHTWKHERNYESSYQIRNATNVTKCKIIIRTERDFTNRKRCLSFWTFTRKFLKVRFIISHSLVLYLNKLFFIFFSIEETNL